jgi:Zn-dependent M28 family amino/carboxypeptidase
MEADLGADKVYATRYLGAPEGKERFATLAELVRGLGVTFDTNDATGGSDTAPLRELGIPVIDARQDASRYFDYHHTANDTFDKVDKGNITQAAAVFATLGYAIADMDGDFGRIPQDKRKMMW